MNPLEMFRRIKLVTIIGICLVFVVYLELKHLIGIKESSWALPWFGLVLEMILGAVSLIIILQIAFELVATQMAKLKHKQEEFEEMGNLLKQASGESDRRNVLLQRKIDEISNLQRIIREMAQTMDLNKILKIILESISIYLQYDRVSVLLMNEEAGALEGIEGLGIDIEKLKNLKIQISDKTNFAVTSLLEKQPKVLFNYRDNPLIDFDIFKEIDQKAILACCPLEAKGRVIGILIVDNVKSKRQIEEKDLRALLTFANQAGLAIENARLYETERRFKEKLQEEVDMAVKKLEKAQDQLIQAEKLSALGEMAAIVTHEVRNPLSTIRGSAELMQEMINKNDPSQKYIDFILKEVDRLNKVVGDILSFSHKPQLTLKKSDINQVIDELVSFLELTDFVKVGVKCIKELDKTLPPFDFDVDRIKQATLNIIQNACHFMVNRGVKQLTVVTKKNNENVEVEISDTGPGIPPENFNKIFEPFFTTRTRGTGLGLAVSRNIVETHGGKLDVRSQIGIGTTFIISLPLTTPSMG